MLTHNASETEPWTPEEIESGTSTAGKVERVITLYFNGIRTSFTASPLTAALLPDGKRGERQKFIHVAVVELWKHLLPHLNEYEMAIGITEMVDDLRSHFDTTQSDVISTAIVWWSKQDNTQTVKA